MSFADLGVGMAIDDGDEDTPGQTRWVGLGAHAIVFGKSPLEVATLTLAGETPEAPVGPVAIQERMATWTVAVLRSSGSSANVVTTSVHSLRK